MFGDVIEAPESTIEPIFADEIPSFREWREGRTHSRLDFATGALVSSIIWFAILLWLLKL